MMYTKRVLVILVAISMLVVSCKRKKASLSGDEPVTVSDFIEAFEPVALPYRITDTLVNKKDKDSSLISHKIITQFIPDSIFHKAFGKDAKPKIYAIGKAGIEKKENYLLAKAISGTKKVVYIFCFDKGDNFSGAMQFLAPDQNPASQQSGLIDKNYTITKSIQRKNGDGNISEGKDVYVFNAETKSFMLIMTDALDEKPAEVINPIDTISKKNKFHSHHLNL